MSSLFSVSVTLAPPHENRPEFRPGYLMSATLCGSSVKVPILSVACCGQFPFGLHISCQCQRTTTHETLDFHRTTGPIPGSITLCRYHYKKRKMTANGLYLSLCGPILSPKIAVPTRTKVAPSFTAVSNSPLIPMESSAMGTLAMACLRISFCKSLRALK